MKNAILVRHMKFAGMILGLSVVAALAWTQSSRAAQVASPETPSLPGQAAPEPQTVTDGPVTMQVRVDSSSALVADPIAVRITIEGPAELLVTPPPFGDRLGDFDVVNVNRWSDLPADLPQRRRWVTLLTIESLRTGSLQIPTIEVACSLDGNSRLVSSRPVPIVIASVLSEEEKPDTIRPMKETIDAPLTSASRFGASQVMIAAAAVMLAATVVAILIVRKRRKISPAARARDQIESLQAESPPPAYPDACGRISQILRSYLEAELGITATTQTSEELIQALAEIGRLDSESKAEVGQLVLEADRSRYRGTHQMSGEVPISRLQHLIDRIEAAPDISEAA